MPITPNTFSFNALLALTGLILVFKFTIALYFGRNIWHIRRNNDFHTNREQYRHEYQLNLYFFLCFIFVFLSRIFFMIFDYYYTHFDLTLYVTRPGLYYWIVGMAISALAVFFVFNFIDRKILNNRWKGIEYLYLLSILVAIFHPYETVQDFQAVSFWTLIMQWPNGVIVLDLLRIAFKDKSPLGKFAVYYLSGQCFLMFAATIVNASVIIYFTPYFGDYTDVVVYTTHTIMKIVSFLLMFKAAITINPQKWLNNLWIIEKNSGICIFEANFQATTMDSTLLSGFFSALQSFGQELTKKDIDQIHFRDLRIYFKPCQCTLIALAVKAVANDLEIRLFLDNIAQAFEERFHQQLGQFCGDIAIFNGFLTTVESQIQQKSISLNIFKAKNMFTP